MVLRAIEQKIESLFEGVFGRAFRTNVQPVELARKLAKEMDDHRTVSVSRVYVPNEYTVYLSSADHEQFTGYESSLVSELEEYLAEHAKRESYALLTPAKVLLEVDEDLDLGEFGIATRMVQPRQGGARKPVADAPEGQVEPGATMIYKPKTAAAPAAEDAPPPEVEREVAILNWDGQTMRVDKRRVLLGRSRECDIQVEDPNVSRRHAELRQEGSTYWIVDLESTNGVEVNGERVKRARLSSGDTFTVGSTEISFTTERE
jgi:FHA domain-containing protein